MTSDLLANVRRSNTSSRTFASATIRPFDQSIVQKGFSVIGEQSVRLQKNLHWLFLQNKKILEDNRCIVMNMMRLRYQNVKNLNELLTCTVSAIQSLESNVSSVEKISYQRNTDQEGRRRSESLNNISEEDILLTLGTKSNEEQTRQKRIENGTRNRTMN